MLASKAHKIGDNTVRTTDISINEDITFEGLILSDATLAGLTSCEFEKPSPIQFKAIPLGKCGFDLIAQAKSGTGKTCMFGVITLEMLELPSKSLQVLILAPTREIAIQVSDVISTIGQGHKGLHVVPVIGGLPIEEDRRKIRGAHVLVATPGRLCQLLSEGSLDISHVRLLVLDEADKLLDPSFITDVSHILSLLPEKRQTLASSATYTAELKDFLEKIMRNPIRVSPDMSVGECGDCVLLGVRQCVALVQSHSSLLVRFQRKLQSLMAILSVVPFKQCLVFNNMHGQAEATSHLLTGKGWPTQFISGHMDQERRLQAISDLVNFQCRVLLSTDLSSRGLDAANVDLVVNIDIPRNAATYLHRVGRAGRFGTKGLVISLCENSGKELQDLVEMSRKIPVDLGYFCISPSLPVPSDLQHIPLPSLVSYTVLDFGKTPAEILKDKNVATSEILADPKSAQSVDVCGLKMDPQVLESTTDSSISEKKTCTPEKTIDSPISESTTDSPIPEKTANSSISEKTTDSSIPEKSTVSSIPKTTAKASISEKTTDSPISEKSKVSSIPKKTADMSISEKKTNSSIPKITIDSSFEKAPDSSIPKNATDYSISERTAVSSISNSAIESSISEKMPDSAIPSSAIESSNSEKTPDSIPNKTIDSPVPEKIDSPIRQTPSPTTPNAQKTNNPDSSGDNTKLTQKKGVSAGNKKGAQSIDDLIAQLKRMSVTRKHQEQKGRPSMNSSINAKVDSNTQTKTSNSKTKTSSPKTDMKISAIVNSSPKTSQKDSSPIVNHKMDSNLSSTVDSNLSEVNLFPNSTHSKASSPQNNLSKKDSNNKINPNVDSNHKTKPKMDSNTPIVNSSLKIDDSKLDSDIKTNSKLDLTVDLNPITNYSELDSTSETESESSPSNIDIPPVQTIGVTFPFEEVLELSVENDGQDGQKCRCNIDSHKSRVPSDLAAKNAEFIRKKEEEHAANPEAPKFFIPTYMLPLQNPEIFRRQEQCSDEKSDFYKPDAYPWSRTYFKNALQYLMRDAQSRRTPPCDDVMGYNNFEKCLATYVPGPTRDDGCFDRTPRFDVENLLMGIHRMNGQAITKAKRSFVKHGGVRNYLQMLAENGGDEPDVNVAKSFIEFERDPNYVPPPMVTREEWVTGVKLEEETKSTESSESSADSENESTDEEERDAEQENVPDMKQTTQISKSKLLPSSQNEKKTTTGVASKYTDNQSKKSTTSNKLKDFESLLKTTTEEQKEFPETKLKTPNIVCAYTKIGQLKSKTSQSEPNELENTVGTEVESGTFLSSLTETELQSYSEIQPEYSHVHSSARQSSESESFTSCPMYPPPQLDASGLSFQYPPFPSLEELNPTTLGLWKQQTKLVTFLNHYGSYMSGMQNPGGILPKQ